MGAVGNRNAVLLSRLLLVLAILCSFISITASVVRFMINDHGGFFFGMQGFLDDDGEPYFAAAPIWQLGRQFPTYLLGTTTLITLLVAAANWSDSKNVVRWLGIALATSASVYIALALSWYFNYPVLYDRWINCWGTHHQELGVGAFALLLTPGFTFMSMHLQRRQPA
jgi:hypothetical protein